MAHGVGPEHPAPSLGARARARAALLPEAGSLLRAARARLTTSSPPREAQMNSQEPELRNALGAASHELLPPVPIRRRSCVARVPPVCRPFAARGPLMCAHVPQTMCPKSAQTTANRPPTSNPKTRRAQAMVGDGRQRHTHTAHPDATFTRPTPHATLALRRRKQARRRRHRWQLHGNGGTVALERALEAKTLTRTAAFSSGAVRPSSARTARDPKAFCGQDLGRRQRSSGVKSRRLEGPFPTSFPT